MDFTKDYVIPLLEQINQQYKEDGKIPTLDLLLEDLKEEQNG